MELNAPHLTEGLTGQPQVAGPVVVMAMGEHGTVQVTKILGGKELVTDSLHTASFPGRSHYNLLPRTHRREDGGRGEGYRAPLILSWVHFASV